MFWQACIYSYVVCTTCFSSWVWIFEPREEWTIALCVTCGHTKLHRLLQHPQLRLNIAHTSAEHILRGYCDVHAVLLCE